MTQAVKTRDDPTHIADVHYQTEPVREPLVLVAFRIPERVKEALRRYTGHTGFSKQVVAGRALEQYLRDRGAL
jgi:hypothetical protein